MKTVIVGGVAGGAMGFAGASSNQFLVAARLAGVLSHLETLPWWLVAAVPVFLALDIAFQWLLLRRQEVKL